MVPPSLFEEAEIQTLIRATRKKWSLASVPPEYIPSRNLVWMPYHKIEYEYARSEDDLIRKFGETGKSETAINAMFCRCAQIESEFFRLFRPNYLKYNMIKRTPPLSGINGPTFSIDFDAVLFGLLTKLNEAMDELCELRSTLSKRYASIRRRSIVLPIRRDLKEANALSEKTAKLSSLTNVLNMSLNLDEGAHSIKTSSISTFYYPTVVVALENSEHEASQFLIIDLVRKGSIRQRLNCDDGLTQLCNKNDACKEVLKRCVA